MLTSKTNKIDIPSIKDIQSARKRLGNLVRETPIWPSTSNEINKAISSSTEVFLKLELFQFGGSFEPRGALTKMELRSRISCSCMYEGNLLEFFSKRTKIPT